MENELPFGYTHRQKRSHAQMELEGSSSPAWAGFSNFDRVSVSREPSASAPHPRPSGLHLPHMSTMPAAAPRRYPGDGLDYRRPISSAAVIDLTNDGAGPSASAPSDPQRESRPRQPRFGREIMGNVIDVEAYDAERPAPAIPSSPEIQFVSARRRDTPQRPPSFGQHSLGDDEVEFVRENPLPEMEARRRQAARSMSMSVDVMQAMLEMPDFRDHHAPRLREMVERRANAAQAHRQRQATMHRILHIAQGGARAAPRAPRRHPGPVHIGFMPPTFNYHAAAFDLGVADEEGDFEAPVPPPPIYNAPENAPQGYTRSPQEQDALVCPNCADELCIGESEQKKQVWIAKSCGHVYCGECTANRSVKKSAKGKEKQAPARTKPFKECVVEGCQKKVANPKAMIQVFL